MLTDTKRVEAGCQAYSAQLYQKQLIAPIFCPVGGFEMFKTIVTQRIFKNFFLDWGCRSQVDEMKVKWVSGGERGESEEREGCCVYSALEVCVSLKSPARLSASSSDMSAEAPSRLRLRRPERLEEKLLTGPPRLEEQSDKKTSTFKGAVVGAILGRSQFAFLHAGCDVRRSIPL